MKVTQKHTLAVGFVSLLLIALTLGYFNLPPTKTISPVPNFNENYAFEVIQKYESFGPKVPGTAAHVKAGDWIAQELKKLNLMVHEQVATGVTFDQKTIPIRNIIAQWNPKAKTRYILSGHWDNRPFADQDDPRNKSKAVPGVNDGGSGVAVLFAIAESVSKLAPESFGIDFAFWDSEDWGMPHTPESYCLGSQYWASHLVPENYKAKYGINYDMVGRIGSVFPIDSYSKRVAPQVIDGLRTAASKLGYRDFFPDYRIGPIVDDHYFVSEKTKIPFVDLIYMNPEGHFPPEWHTINDTSEFISRDVLKVVGQTTLQFIWDDSLL